MANWTIRTKMILLLIPAIILVLVLGTLFSLQVSSDAQKGAAYDSTLNSARAYARDFNAGMSENLVISRTFSTILDQNTGITRQGVLDIQHTLLHEHPKVIGIGVIFEPETFDVNDARYANTPGQDATGRFATYWNRLSGNESIRPVVDIETSDWYIIPKTTGKEVVMEPLIYEGVLMTSYITPIIRNNTFTGTVGMDVSLDSIDQTVNKVKIFDTGYAFLVSNGGIFISYPKKDYIGRMSLSQLANQTNNPGLAAMAIDIHEGKEGYLEMDDPVTGKNAVMFYTPITTGNWSMVLVAPTDEMLAGVKALGRIMLLIGIFSIVLVGAIIFIVARNLSGPIVAMSRTADKIASGDLDVRVPGQDGELGVLAHAFNNMTSRLREVIENLQEKVTELQNTQAALSESEEKYRTLLESMAEYIIVHRDGIILYLNPAMENGLKYSSKELLNHSMMPLIAPEFHEKVTAAMKQRMAGDDIEPYEIDIMTGDGRRRTIIIQGKLIQFEGAPASLNFLTDITDKKIAEKKIQLANNKLALMTDVAYQDIQNKVTALRGYVDISKKTANEEERLSILKKEDEILAAIHHLIRHTKEYQQMGADKFRWISLENAIRVQAALVSRKGLLDLDINLAGLEIYSDPLIERVIFNLIENTVKHGKNATKISFNLQETPDGLILICEDDGVGVPPEYKDRIFDRVVGEGRFGLFFVREFLNLSGMSITETGTPGKGARFKILVPKGMYRFNPSDKFSN
jgi:PAS domain S-box-containing protein